MSRGRLLQTAGWVTLAAIIGGLGSYVMLIVVARSVTPAEFGRFSTFWTVVLVLGLGLYQPLEQETSRRLAPTSDQTGRPLLLRTVGAFVAILTGVVVVVVAASGAWLDANGVLDWPLLIAVALTCVAYAFVFPIRGVVSGRHRPYVYASMVATDGLLRIVIPVALALAAIGVAGYAFAVPVIVLLAAVPAIGELQRVRHQHLPATTIGSFSSSAMRIIVAAFSIQALLGAPVLLASVAAPNDPALPGQILSVLTLARIPVLIYQSLQVLYLPRVARAHALAEHPGRIIGAAAAAAVIAGGLMLLAFSLLGSWVIGVLFGPQMVLGTDIQLLLAAGSGLFLVALVLSDACVATGRHTTLVAVWIPSLAVSIGLFALSDAAPGLRASIPLIGGSAVAAVSFAIVLAIGARPQSSSRSRYAP